MKYFLVDRLAGEPAFSWIERSAGLNCCNSGRQLLDDLRVKPRKLRMGNADTLETIGRLFDISMEELRRDTPILEPLKRTWRINGELLDQQHLRLSKPLSCSKCLSSNLFSIGLPLLGKCIPVIVSCVEHDLLLTVSNDNSLPIAANSNASRYLLRRLQLKQKCDLSSPLLNTMSWRAAARAIRFVGGRLLEWKYPKAQTQIELHEILEAGFSALQTQELFVEALNQIVSRVPAGKEIGETRAYGARLLSLCEKPICEETGDFSSVLNSHAADHISVRDCDDRGDSVRTIVSLAPALKIHAKTLALIVANCDQPDFFKRHRLVSKPLLAKLRIRLAETLNQKAVFFKFGLTVLPGKELARLGIIKPLYPSAFNKRTYSCEDIREVIERLAGTAPIVATCPVNLKSVPDCAAKIRRPISAIFKLICDGLIAVEARGPEVRFDQLYVDPTRIRAALLGETKSAGIPRRAAERQLKTTGPVIDALIAIGLIEAVIEDSPIPRSRRVVVLEDSIKSFQKHFIMSLEIIDRTGMSFKHFKRDLAAHGLKPLDEPSVPATIYDRASFELLIQQGLIATRASPFSQT